MGQPQAAPHFDLVVIGASAGGVEALETILPALPKPLPVPMCVVIHLSPDHRSVLAEVLSRTSGRQVVWATHGSTPRPGVVYLGPPDRHFEIQAGGHIALMETPRVHHARPAVDRLFGSAADVFAARVIAVILTGNGVDGSAGALAVCKVGGVVIAQDHATSAFDSMPRHAIEAHAATMVLPLTAIAAAITRLVSDGAATGVEPATRPPNAEEALATRWPPDRLPADAREAEP